MVNICSPTSYKGEGQTRVSSASLPTPQLTCKEDPATLDGALVVCCDGAALCCHLRVAAAAAKSLQSCRTLRDPRDLRVEEPFKTQPVSE